MLVQSGASPEVRFVVSKTSAGPSRVGLLVLLLALTPVPDARAFTQSGVGVVIADGIPMGHEWITRFAALELLGGDPVVKPDPNDPRRNWTQGKAKNLDLSGAQAEVQRIKSQQLDPGDQGRHRYQPMYKWVYHAIVGERWVDVGGFNVTGSEIHSKHNCWDAVAQEPAELQYDHFMRRYDESGGEGGVQAARRSRERFIQYFVNAAMAPTTVMTIWDGGGFSVKVEVDRNYFLFGRAAHLFEDSFSPEHTVRLPRDNPERVRQVKSYLCAAGSEQHAHTKNPTKEWSGDVVWTPNSWRKDPGWESYKPSNMTDIALVATEATKDLWAAFIRTMGTPREHREGKARAEAETLARNWLDSNDAETRDWYKNVGHRDKTYVLGPGESGPGQSMPDCMRGLGVKSGDQMEMVRTLQNTQRACLYNVVSRDGYQDLFDPSLRVPYNWEWLNKLKIDDPQPNFKVSDRDRPADTGVRIRIKCPNGHYLVAPKVQHDAWIYCRPGQPLELIQVGDARNTAVLRLRYAPNLFVSYTAATGAVKLFNSPREANLRIVSVGGGWTIESLHRKQYMWLSKESPYFTHAGKSGKPDAKWLIESVP